MTWDYRILAINDGYQMIEAYYEEVAGKPEAWADADPDTTLEDLLSALSQPILQVTDFTGFQRDLETHEEDNES